MSVCLRMHVNMCVINVHVQLYMCASVRVCVYIYVCVHVCAQVWLCMRIGVCAWGGAFANLARKMQFNPHRSFPCFNYPFYHYGFFYTCVIFLECSHALCCRV